MSVAVVVPYRPGPGREGPFMHVTTRLRADGWPVLIADADGDAWCKADAVAHALDVPMHPDDVVVVHDADVVAEPHALRWAIDAVEEHGRWAIPYRNVERLAEKDTGVLLETGALAESPQLTRWPYLGMAGGGIVVLHRDTYDDTPLDRRFVGWGDEDQAWGWALATLHGTPHRHDAPLTHLWHPHAAPGARHTASLEAARVWRAYRAYRDDPIRMRLLVDGGR